MALAIVALAVGAGLWWLLTRPPARPERTVEAEPAPRAASPEPPPRPADRPTPVPKERPEVPPPGPAGTVAILIDDLGRDVEDVDRLEALGVPVSYAVLPYETQTAEVVRRLRGIRGEVLLHLPMEPAGGNDPGPGALRAAMSPRQLRSATRQALDRVPGAVGVNNHMGSKLTGDSRAMRAVLRELRDRRLFFVDSRTTPGTVGFQIARELGLPAAERQVFLDPDPDPEAIRAQFARLLELGRERGAAIAIGHPHPTTLAVLAEEVPRAREQGFVFVPVSFLLERTGGPE